MNFGLKATQAEVVITLDADTLFQPDAIGYLVQHFSDVSVGAVAGNAKVGNRLNILTKWQALEYITSQNLDRRAFEYMNCISVVPGSIGAWRRQAILDEGGFSEKTLAEDADMTLTFLRRGYKVLYEDNARAYTEAPDTVRGFMQQRFRWMFGTLQAAWLHKDTFLKPKYKALGSFVLPNILLFQIFFPLISPIMDITVIVSSLWTWYQRYHHPEGMSTYNLGHLLVFYIVFQLIDFIAASIALLMEKKEDWKLLWWLLPQRFFYRQLLYIIAIRVVLAAIKGKIIMWGSIERKNTAHL
jgi:cellulose synthase/poly-beta-1,6-N-acetylglucosamine synthase-like glycosyltransferase